MNQVEKEFKSKLEKYFFEEVNDLEKILNSFFEICKSMNLNDREDVGLYSIIADLFGFEFTLSLYFQLVKTEEGQSTDTSSKCTLTICCNDENDLDLFDRDSYEIKKLETELDLEEAFIKVREMEVYKKLKNIKVDLYL